VAVMISLFGEGNQNIQKNTDLHRTLINLITQAKAVLGTLGHWAGVKSSAP